MEHNLVLMVCPILEQTIFVERYSHRPSTKSKKFLIIKNINYVSKRKNWSNNGKYISDH